MSNIEKKIAIRGHKNRSVEVIDILKQLGGKNSYPLSGGYEGNIYFIDNYNVIDYMPLTIKDIDKYYQIYTLEEYLETLNQTEQIKSTNMEKTIEQKNDKTQRQLSVDIETAKQWYKTNNETLKQLALSVFTEEELTKVEFPTTWEEFCEQNSGVDCEYYINDTSEIDFCKVLIRNIETDKNLLETQEDAEAILALIQLKRLRDAWWKALNYQANWSDGTNKFSVLLLENDIIPVTTIWSSQFLAFPTYESCFQFIYCFQHLILKAKPFLS